MKPPRWTRALLRTLAPSHQSDDVLGDFEEAHCRRLQRHGRVTAHVLTTLDTLDMAAALVRGRVAAYRTNLRSSTVQDYKLGLRMLVKYPGVTFAGGLALAIAIGIGAGWYDLSGDLFRPTIPLPEGDRIVEVEMRNLAGSEDERRILHDFVNWREHARSLEDLGAYRTIERNLILSDGRPEPVTVAEITAAGFRVARVPPLLGRPLLDADDRPGAAPVAVLSHLVWQQRFGGRLNVVGETIQLGRLKHTVVGVMPERFSFPINHRLWVPMQLEADGYAPLEGGAVRVFGRLAPGVTQAQAYAEVTTLTERVAAASPRTHEHLRPRVLAYGGESPGDKPLLEVIVTHLPTVLVLLIACVNVGTLLYARTATRDAEIAVRYALGASRGRIVGQLFIEALVLASFAAALGLAVAHAGLKWGVTAFYSGQSAGLPFWVDPGLKLTTVLYALGLTVFGAAILGVLPALKVTGRRVQAQLRNLGAGGSTLKFGKLWTSAMIGQVALTVICIPPAMGISHEVLRDHRIRDAFPTEEYLAARIGLDQDGPQADGTEAPAAFAERFQRIYQELERRVSAEAGVIAVTFADRLPGMQPAVAPAEVEVMPGAQPVRITNLWTASVGPRFFEAFDVPLVAGRDFHDGDRAPGARTVLVNEALARRYLAAASPVGRRVRFTRSASTEAEPWFEIVGMVRDVGMTPTDLGEAPYLFRAVSPATASPLVMGIRVAGDPSAVAPRLRAIAADLDPALRLDEVRTLEDYAWRIDVPSFIAAGAVACIVVLGLFLSAAGIFALMSVSVARRTREIGLRAALGASPARLLRGIFTRALVLIGSGVVAGNGVLLLVVYLNEEVTLGDVGAAVVTTSMVMLTVGLVACAEPARRALRIAPTDALKEA